MQNKFLVLLLLSLIVPITAYAYSDQVIINMGQNGMQYHNGIQYYGNREYYDHFLPSEKYLRRQLYWLYNYNPHYLELINFPVDYFLTVVTEHIKILENKIAAKKNGLRSNAMLRGTIFSAFSMLWGCIACDVYAKRASFNDPQEVIVSTVILGAVSALLAAIAGTQFDRVYRHAERLVERLERDKRIVAALERVKVARNDNEGNGAASSPYMVNSTISALNSLAQPLMLSCVPKT